MTSLCKLGKQPQAAETGPQVASHVETPVLLSLLPSHPGGARRDRVCMVRVQEVAQNQIRVLGPRLFWAELYTPKRYIEILNPSTSEWDLIGK